MDANGETAPGRCELIWLAIAIFGLQSQYMESSKCDFGGPQSSKKTFFVIVKAFPTGTNHLTNHGDRWVSKKSLNFRAC